MNALKQIDFEQLKVSLKLMRPISYIRKKVNVTLRIVNLVSVAVATNAEDLPYQHRSQSLLPNVIKLLVFPFRFFL